VQHWYLPSDPDRVESLKTAILTGLTAALVAALVLLVHRGAALGVAAALGSALHGLRGLTFWVSVAIAALSGSLFGITYRYAVRRDRNLQLKTGVILAFTLVRGLALVNVGDALSLQGWPFVSAVCDSLLLFGVAGAALEGAMYRQWIRPVDPSP
jgi:hypothetical protein